MTRKNVHMLRILIGMLLVVAMAVSVTARGQVELENAEPDLVVVNIADTHSAYDAYPRLVTAFEAVADSYDSETEVVFLFNGDLFELGVVVASRSEGEADWVFLERLSELGTVVVNVGNHEFDFMGPSDFVSAAETAGAVVIGTVHTEDDQQLTPASVDIDVAGEVLRIVGIGTDQSNTYPEALRERLRITDPVEWVSENWSEVTAGADHTVLASHAGLVADVTILDSLEGHNAPLFAVGGHDHITFRETVNGVPYMHNGFRGERFNITEVYRTPLGMRTVFRDVSLESVDQANDELSDLIARLRDEHLTDEDLATVGTLSEDMTVLEAAMWSVEQVRSSTNADAAFLNHTSFGSGLPAGPLPRYRFDQFMRFDNDVMQATVDADTMRTILGHANQHLQDDLRSRTGDFLYTGNLTVQDGREYEIVTSSWVALDFNQEGYLGTTVEFEQIPDITTKGILVEAM
ncbi:MAG: metallophosphoesterase, partial [Alkalispirochaeta sp.]